MKKTILMFLLIPMLCYAQRDDIIKGEESFSGTLDIKDSELTISYEGRIKYVATLFGGVKINANIVDFKINSILYKQRDINDVLKKKITFPLRLEKSSLFTVYTDIVFHHKKFYDLTGGYHVRFKYKKFLSIGWGSIDEYIYLKDEEFKRIKGNFNISKGNLGKFYTLGLRFENLRITKILSDRLREINSLTYLYKSNQRKLENKYNKLIENRNYRDVSLSRLNYKLKTVNELLSEAFKECYECVNIKNEIINEIERRKNKESRKKDEDFLAEEEPNERESDNDFLAEEVKNEPTEKQTNVTNSNEDFLEEKRTVKKARGQLEKKTYNDDFLAEDDSSNDNNDFLDSNDDKNSDFLKDNELSEKTYNIIYRGGKMGVVDKKENTLIPFKNWKILNYRNGIAQVAIELNKNDSFPDEEYCLSLYRFTGFRVVKKGYVDYTGDFVDSPLYTAEVSLGVRNGLTGFTYKKGEYTKAKRAYEKWMRKEKEGIQKCWASYEVWKKQIENKYN